MTLRILTVAALLLCPGSSLVAQILFAPPHTMQAEDETLTGLAAGDVDGDGFADLALAHGPFLPPGVRLGDGAGNFGAELVVDQPIAGSVVALAELTGDRVPDMLIAQLGFGGRLQVLPGLGDGTFGAAVTYAALAYELHTGDADGDGDVDVVSVTPGPLAGLGEAQFLRNDGTGTLVAEVVPSPAGLLMDDALAADVNADGRADLLVSGAIAGPVHQTRVLLGNASGGFDAAGTLAAGPLIAVIDLDGDGLLDVLAQDAGPDSAVRALLGAGNGSFAAGPLTAVPVSFDETRGVADFDGDGVTDLVIGTAFPAEAHFLRGAGDGGFGNDVPFSFLPNTNAWFRLLGDFDGDGRTDAAALLKNNLSSAVPDELLVAFNRSYVAGGPLLDLGHALLGSHGWPIQVAEGAFAPGSPFAFAIAGAPPSGVLAEYVGATSGLRLTVP